MSYWFPPLLCFSVLTVNGMGVCRSLCTRTQLETASCLWLPSSQLCPFCWDGGSGWPAPQDQLPCPPKSVRWRFALVSPLHDGNEEAVRPHSCSPWKYLRREVTSWETSSQQLAEPGRPGSQGCRRRSQSVLLHVYVLLLWADDLFDFFS